MKTSELIDAPLDWAVTVINYKLAHGVGYITCIPPGKGWVSRDEHRYSTDWAHGGPIIEREIAKIERFSDALWEATAFTKNAQDFVQNGPTPLVAAMRAYVASKLGDEVEVPAVLED